MATECPPKMILRKSEKLDKDASSKFLNRYIQTIERFQDEKSGSESVLSQLNRVLMYLKGEEIPLISLNLPVQGPPTEELIIPPEEMLETKEEESLKHAREENDDLHLDKETKKRLKKEKKKAARREKEEARKAKADTTQGVGEKEQS
ncbi:DNA-directed RNA polymerase I subunit rpa14 [Schizosaccharomyces pombe]|uniref:DNA-directed RNA polymerase I subunit rpa14 n=1 Tax=Schizosaccharomyces pombe (strain 972 / ATCC 24843) TaxID=284812 RepID=RPA14_SCHPO|nr:DNA-directed RNA polymerase I complex subunit Ker1 [Schizosaccharomyces pombe]Q9P7P1.1 RecName: Full=DNA-directed RNA polymerase I subunit rpa14; Short=RNA polymerase I subunit A14; AltName: Full=DNA-directed RNA polymerase I 17 kDa polypeptide; AltName: Full=Nucleolar protein ker1 [Schizosaccharomyces pombe 972h-]7AOC_D Chain D, DNA-directed RNA polymerase I subunit rpa14 [Schizosaccharomyces pombe 972h-]7AOD_D Chain D, DNA-directed RNA polymerase I subunit rpa14 [Schizosaccharomyces pombe 9|eukprot:NP_596449.1 DNA-directed RNA polymerase I complex subunit Ker1 [Schizosaccharomyces pombe]